MENFLKGIKSTAKKGVASVKQFFTPDDNPEVRLGEFLREIPGSTGKVAADMARSIPRSILSTALTVAPKKVEKNIGSIKPEEDFGTVGKWFLGDDEIKPIPEMGTETLESLGVGEEKAKKYGPIVGFGLTAMDLYPGTSGKGKAIKETLEGVIPKLIKEADPKKVIETLVKSGADEKIATQVADDLAKATTEAEVRSILGVEGKSQVPAKKPTTRATASQGGEKLYHGTNDISWVKDGQIQRSETSMLGNGGVFFTKDPEVAKSWIPASGGYSQAKASGKTGGVVEINPVGGKGFNLKKMSEAEYEQEFFKAMDELRANPEKFGTDKYGVHEGRGWDIAEQRIREQGYDGIDFGDQGVIFDPKRISAKLMDEDRNIPRGTGSARSIGEILEGKGGDVPPPKRPTAKGGEPKAPKEPERRFVTRTREMAPQLDEFLQGKYARRSTAELAENAKKIIDDDFEKAEILAKTGTDDQAVAVASKMIEDAIASAEKAAKAGDEVAKRMAYERAADIANDAAKNLTEAGRTVQAASLLGRMTPEGMAAYAQRQIQKYNEGIAKGTIGSFLGKKEPLPKLSADQMEYITSMMKKINGMADGTDKNKEIFKLQQYIGKIIPSTLTEKIIAFWKAGLLTGLKTTGLNITANLSNAITEVAKDLPASMVDAVVSMFTGQRTNVFTTKGSVKGAGEGVKKGWEFLKTGFDERNVLDKLDYRKVNYSNSKVGKAAQAYVDTVFGVLGAEDQAFYYSARMRSLASQAMAKARNEGLKGDEAVKFVQNLIENPTDDMVKYATLDAETAVFQQDSWMAKKGKGAQKIFGQILLPFAKTPANVADAMISYSPVGIARTIIQNIGKGKFDQRIFSQGVGRGLTGTAVLAIGAALYNKGMMALNYPTSEKERNQWELEGRNRNSIKIGDKWRNVGILGPLGMVAIVGGHLQEGIKETGSFVGGLVQAAGGAGSALTEQSFLTGVNKAVEALQDPSRSFEGFASSLAGSIVPTLVADFARATDTYERRTEGPMERMISRIPGLRQALEPRVDAFGKKIKTANFLEVMADPSRPGNASAPNDPVTLELRRLIDAGHNSTWTKLGDKKGYETLSQEENTYLWQLSGVMAKKAAEEAMNTKFYKGLDDELKAKYLKKVVDQAKNQAKGIVIAQVVKGLKGTELESTLEKMKEDGLLTNAALGFYLDESDK